MNKCCNILGYIIEQNGMILVEKRDEAGNFSPYSLSLPFLYSSLDADCINLVRTEIKKQFCGAKIVQIQKIFCSQFKSDNSVSVSFFHVTLDREILLDCNHRKWVSSNSILKNGYGIFPKVIDAYLKNKIEILN